MRQVMVRYRVKPGRAAENEDLVRAVYAELHQAQPPGFRYATYQLDGYLDGWIIENLAQVIGEQLARQAVGPPL